MVVTDSLTKFAIVVPLPDKSKIQVVRALYFDVIVLYGCPKVIISDRGKEFLNWLTKCLNRLCGTTHVFTCRFHPQGDGQSERFNRTLCEMLCHYVSENQKDWQSFLKEVTADYNNSIHSATLDTPFYLMHGQDKRIPLDIEFRVDEHTQRKIDKDTWIDELFKAIGRAKIINETQKKRMMLQYRVGEKKVFYPTQSIVLLQNDPKPKQGLMDKLRPKMIGPYRIVNRSPDGIVYKLRHITSGKTRDGVHISQIRPLIAETVGNEWIFESNDVENSNAHDALKVLAETDHYCDEELSFEEDEIVVEIPNIVDQRERGEVQIEHELQLDNAVQIRSETTVQTPDLRSNIVPNAKAGDILDRSAGLLVLSISQPSKLLGFIDEFEHIARELPEIEEIAIVTKATREKFLQNSKIKELLMATGNKYLIHCDPKNEFWGESKGKGRNELGKILMKIRAELNGIEFSLPARGQKRNQISFHALNQAYSEFSSNYLSKFEIEEIAYQSVLQYHTSKLFDHITIRKFLESSKKKEDWKMDVVMKLRQVLANENENQEQKDETVNVQDKQDEAKQLYKPLQYVDIKFTDGWYCARVKKVEFVNGQWRYLVAYEDENEDDEIVPNEHTSLEEIRPCRITKNHKRSANVSVFTSVFINHKENKELFPNYFEPFEYQNLVYHSVLHLALMLIASENGHLGEVRKLIKAKKEDIEKFETTIVENWGTKEIAILERAYVIKACHNSNFRNIFRELESDEIISLGLGRLTTGILNSIVDQRRWIYPNILGKVLTNVRKKIMNEEYRKTTRTRKRTNRIEIEKIISHRTVNNERKFLVKYLGLADRYNIEVEKDKIPTALFESYALEHNLDA
jgi:predicted NAD-dependent protein-ADP-ribosyltransferase YbiA (DUF1768 family)